MEFGDLLQVLMFDSLGSNVIIHGQQIYSKCFQKYEENALFYPQIYPQKIK